MSRRIRVKSSPLNRIKVTSQPLEQIEKEEVRTALGGEESTVSLSEQGPLSLFAIRQHLVEGLVSRGGRPGLKEATRRQKIPLADEDWSQLEELAELLQDDEVHPTPGQVASILLRQALIQVDVPQLRVQFKSEQRHRS